MFEDILFDALKQGKTVYFSGEDKTAEIVMNPRTEWMQCMVMHERDIYGDYTEYFFHQGIDGLWSLLTKISGYGYRINVEAYMILD